MQTRTHVSSAALALMIIALPVASEGAELTIKAEYEPESRAHQLDLVVGTFVRSYYGFIPGIFYGFPVAPQGFIRPVNDAFYIEFGLLIGAFFHSDLDPFFWFSPQAGVRWEFYLTQAWSVFAAVRLGWGFEFVDYVHGYTWPYLSGSVGAHWHFSDSFALRLETGGGIFGYHLLAGISWQI